jgi:hypothetical protein
MLHSASFSQPTFDTKERILSQHFYNITPSNSVEAILVFSSWTKLNFLYYLQIIHKNTKWKKQLQCNID